MVQEKKSEDKSKQNENNLASVLTVLINNFFNLFKAEKVACIVILYLIYRDNYFAHLLKEQPELADRLIDTNIILKILDSSTPIIILVSIIVVLICIIGLLIFINKTVYKKEIDRLSALRSELVHDISNGKFTSIVEHKSSAN